MRGGWKFESSKHAWQLKTHARCTWASTPLHASVFLARGHICQLGWRRCACKSVAHGFSGAIHWSCQVRYSEVGRMSCIKSSETAHAFRRTQTMITQRETQARTHTKLPACPSSPPPSYHHPSHRFVRNAPSSHADEFWQSVGTAMLLRLSERPVWLSTSGLGIYYLHMRLDSRPKYYTHAPYRQFKSGLWDRDRQ